MSRKAYKSDRGYRKYSNSYVDFLVLQNLKRQKKLLEIQIKQQKITSKEVNHA